MANLDADRREELAFLVGLLKSEKRKPRRAVIIADFAARAVALVPDDADYVRLLADAAPFLPTADGALLLEEYRVRAKPVEQRYQCDLLIVCVKPVERDAVLATLDRAGDAGGAGDRQGSAGRSYFDGELRSEVADRDLTYSLVALNSQGNRSAAMETFEILAECAPRLAVLIGMAAGPGMAGGDVVACEHVLDAGPGTRRDGKRIREPLPVMPGREIRHQVMNNRANRNGWHERLSSAAETAEAAGLVIARRGRDDPAFSTGVIVSDEDKDETTTLAEWLEEYTGDAKAYDMESAGFGDACGRNRDGVDWMVFRGIADGGAEMVDGEAVRPKDLQMWATLSAATCFLTWLTRQAAFFGTDGEK